MNVTTLKERLNLKPLTPVKNTEISGVYAGDFLSRAMSRVAEGNAWITIMNNINVIAVADLTDCACVILAEDAVLLPDALKAAEEKEINIFSSPLSAYDICIRIHEESGI